MTKKLYRHLQDSNLRGRSPRDFESHALTTRPRCRIMLKSKFDYMNPENEKTELLSTG
jgi:hypothetical protein